MRPSQPEDAHDEEIVEKSPDGRYSRVRPRRPIPAAPPGLRGGASGSGGDWSAWAPANAAVCPIGTPALRSRPRGPRANARLRTTVRSAPDALPHRVRVPACVLCSSIGNWGTVRSRRCTKDMMRRRASRLRGVRSTWSASARRRRRRSTWKSRSSSRSRTRFAQAACFRARLAAHTAPLPGRALELRAFRGSANSRNRHHVASIPAPPLPLPPPPPHFPHRGRELLMPPSPLRPDRCGASSRCAVRRLTLATRSVSRLALAAHPHLLRILRPAQNDADRLHHRNHDLRNTQAVRPGAPATRSDPHVAHASCATARSRLAAGSPPSRWLRFLPMRSRQRCGATPGLAPLATPKC